MKSLVLVFLIFFGLEVVSSAAQEIVLDVDEGVTWEKVFASGFRPQHLSGGKYMCTQYEVPLTIVSSKNNQRLNLGVGDIDFKIKEGGLLVGLSFYGRENRSLEEAKIKSETFAKMFGENVTQGATLQTFQNKHKVDYAGNKIEPPEIEEHVDLKTTTNAARINDFSIIYSFGDSYSDDLPLVERLSVALKSKEAKRAKRLTEKIRPPAGYEHISLEPPPFVASGEKNKSKLESNSQKSIPKAPEEKQSNSEVVEGEKSGSPLWLYWILCALILGGVGVLVWNSRKGSSAS